MGDSTNNTNYNVNELKLQLKAVGAKTSGNKATLANRLRIWQSGDLSRKLYTTRIVPPVDSANFPVLHYNSLDEMQRLNLEWLSVSIIADWFNERRATAGEKKGRKLFFNDFVKQISYCQENRSIFLKGICSAETKKNVDYVIHTQMKIDLCQIAKASCTCPAGTGLSAACKHVSAVLYAIECFVVSGKLPTSSTSKIQQWHRPAGRSLQNSSIDTMLGISNYSSYGSDITNYTINSLLNFKIASPLLSSRKVNFTAYTVDHDYCAESIQFYMLQSINKVSIKEIKRIEKNTKVHNKLWYQVRSSRITASICYNAIRTTNTGRFTSGFLKNHIQPHQLHSNAIKWGLSNEAIAKKKYSQVTGNKMDECGIFIHPELNFLAGTPDGINWGKNLIIEIKCPYTVRNTVPTEAKYISKNGLWKSHAYYHQIQLQMCITGITQCDFIVWTPQSIYIENIKYNKAFVDEMLRKLTIYYKKTFCENYFKYKLA